MLHPELKCSTCGFIPDDDDIEKTRYHLSKCDCGQENVCDLCLTYHIHDFNKSKCPACDPSISAIGKDRKIWLDYEYE